MDHDPFTQNYTIILIAFTCKSVCFWVGLLPESARTKSCWYLPTLGVLRCLLRGCPIRSRLQCGGHWLEREVISTAQQPAGTLMRSSRRWHLYWRFVFEGRGFLFGHVFYLLCSVVLVILL